jgi:hypothetical protein
VKAATGKAPEDEHQRMASMESGTSRIPNLFIVGAPKCGTTSLHTYLGSHPDIFMSVRKEPRFFAPDLDSGAPDDSRYFVRDEREYLAMFREAGSAAYAGESTALYLLSVEAAARIRAFSPDARIIIMVRDPVELMYAFHHERVCGANEDITDFEEALAAENDRRAGLRLPKKGIIPRALQYREVATLTSQIERYIYLFGRNHIHFVVFDDLKRDTPGEYRKILEFLGIDPRFEPDFSVRNRSQRVRSTLVRDLLRRPSPAFREGVRRILPPELRRAVRRGLRSWNFQDATRPPLSPELRRHLQDEFAPEVERLGTLLDRDLSAWSR